MREPVRIFEGSARPHEPFWQVFDQAESDSGEAEIVFYGVISEFSWFEDDITPGKFKSDLEKVGQGGPVTVRIHSPGGDIYAASAIRAMIMDYQGTVTTRIDGICASSATLVASAGDRCLMQDSGMFMIHNPWTVVIGGEEDMKAAIDMLKGLKASILSAYQSKTGLEEARLAKLMTDETWMAAPQALALGFVDEIVTEGAKSQPTTNPVALNVLKNYANVPPELLAARALVKEEDQPVVRLPDLDALEAESRELREYLSIFSFGGNDV